MRSRLRTTQGIVLRRYPFRETSLIATLYTQGYGKVRGLAKGIQTDPKRFGSRLDLFSLNDIVFYERSRGDLDLVSQVMLLNHFAGLESDLGRFGAAGYCIELVDAVTVDHDPDAALFHILVGVLGILQTHEDPEWVVRFLEVRLLERIGLMPPLDVCNHCRAPIKEKSVIFRFDDRGTLCGSCSGGSAVRMDPSGEGRSMGGLVLHRGSLETLARMRSGGQEGEFKVQAYTQVRREITTLLRGVIDMHVGRRLRSVDFVRKANP